MKRYRRLRYLFVLAFVVPVCLALAETNAVPPDSAQWVSPLIELVKALAWLATVVSGALMFQEPLSVFLGAIGSRVSKLSVLSGGLWRSGIHGLRRRGRGPKSRSSLPILPSVGKYCLQKRIKR